MSCFRARAALALFAAAPILALVSITLSPSVARAESSADCWEFGDFRLADGLRLDCDLFVVGGDLEIAEGAQVTGSVNVPVGSAKIEGTVGGDLSVWGDLELGGIVTGTVSAIAGAATISGTVGGDATAGGDMVLSGRVGGKASSGRDLKLKSGAVVIGDALATGELMLDAGAAVGGESDVKAISEARRATQLAWAAAMVLFAALFAALAVSVAPDAIDNIRHAVRRAPLPLIFLGLIALIIAPIISLVLLLVPIPIYLIALAMGAVSLGEGIGERVFQGGGRAARAALGTAVLALIASSAIVFGEGSVARFCLVALFLMLIAALPLGAGLVTFLGRRAWGGAGGDDDWELDGDRTDPWIPPESADEPGAAPSPLLDEAEDSDASESDGAVALPDPIPGPPPPTADRPDDPDAPDGEDEPSTPLPENAVPDTAPSDARSPLRSLPGITPIYAELLHEAGISSIEDLAGRSSEEVIAICEVGGVAPIDHQIAAAWIETAKGSIEGG